MRELIMSDATDECFKVIKQLIDSNLERPLMLSNMHNVLINLHATAVENTKKELRKSIGFQLIR